MFENLAKTLTVLKKYELNGYSAIVKNWGSLADTAVECETDPVWILMNNHILIITQVCTLVASVIVDGVVVIYILYIRE